MKKLAPVTALLSLSALLPFTEGCNDRRHRTRERFEAESQRFRVDAEDFDLEAVLGLVKANRAHDAEDLETLINGNEAINNVDLDADGKVDYVLVKETKASAAGTTLEFWAVPSASQDEAGAELIAHTQFRRTHEYVDVSGRYSGSVYGHDRHHYGYRHHGVGLGEALFLMWAFDRTRSSYSTPYHSAAYRSRDVTSQSELQSRRRRYRSKQGLSAIPRSSPGVGASGSSSGSPKKSWGASAAPKKKGWGFGTTRRGSSRKKRRR